MPYRLQKSGSLFYVVGPSGRHSKKPMPRSRAVRQMRALYASEKGWDAGAGQQIIGNLYRGAGGKFTAGAGGQLTPAQQRQQSRARERGEYGRAEDEQRAREDAAIEAEPNRRKRGALRRQTAAARRARLYARREARRKLDEQDAQARAQDAQNRAQATAERRAARERAVAEHRRQVAERRAQARGERPKRDRKDPAEVRKANRASIRQQMAQSDAGLSPSGFDAFTAFLDGGNLSPDMAQGLAAFGLVDGDPPRLTSVGRTLGRAIDKGNYRGAVDAVNEGMARVKKRQETQAAREAKRRAVEEERRIRAEEDAMLASIADPKARAAFRRDVVRARRERKRLRDNPPPPPGQGEPKKRVGGTAPRPPGGRETPDPVVKGASPSLVVYKDASGRDRWAAITTSAYEDRDREIITREGLRHLVTYGDQTGERGTLRFWHVPGFDLGDCDFQAVSDDGLFLIESGAFRSPTAAAAGARLAAKGWQMSPGFLHPASEPYPAVISGRRVGLYDHPMAFERSLCPPGRASNLYTRFVTKEYRMTIEPQKLEAARAALGDDLLNALLAEQQTQKAAADAANTVYKDAPPWALALMDRIAALETRKAAAPPPEEAMAEMPEEEAALEEEAAGAEGDFIGDLSKAEFAALMQEILAPLVSGLDIEKKIRGHADDIRSMVNGGMAQKDAAIAEVKDAQAVLAQKLAALAGDQPIAAGYRASQDPATALPEAAANALKAHTYQVSAGAAAPADPISAWLSTFNQNGGA